MADEFFKFYRCEANPDGSMTIKGKLDLQEMAGWESSCTTSITSATGRQRPRWTLASGKPDGGRRLRRRWATLQRLRNTLGPSWLVRYRLPADYIPPLKWSAVNTGRRVRTAYERGIERHQDYADFESSFD